MSRTVKRRTVKPISVDSIAAVPSATDPFPRRRERARLTRRRILEAARDLFVERGYVGTTIAAAAERADVSPETIYSTFGNKRALLSALVDVTIAGGEDAAPILEQDWVEQLRAEPDPHRRMRLLAKQGRAILERRTEIDAVVRGAAASDPELEAVRRLGDAQRYAGQRQLLGIVTGPDGLREGLDPLAAADILYAIGSPDVYRLLVTDRGWGGNRFEQWYGDTLDRLLLEPPDRPKRGKPR